MNYEEAVSRARQGEEAGFQFLYESTYKEKYYIAMKYMKNETEAQDVLQDAYIRAFQKLDMLRTPQSFPGWMGQIVANTAKNALQKKQPILFSEMNADSESDTQWEEQIEDEKKDYRPEEAYTKQEIQELVQELIASLSEEQRFCILMFYMENLSIREIAETLDCSENTVKSRLNYGKKALKIKTEDLQKKGYKLYSVAPLPFLLYLLRSQRGEFIQSVNLAGTTEVLDKIRLAVKPEHLVKGSVKHAFLHTMVGKVTIALIGIVFTGVITGAIVYQTQVDDNAKTVPKEKVVAEQPEKPQEKQEEKPEAKSTQEPEEIKPKEVKAEEFASLIAGKLTKQELELVLAYGPKEIPVQGFLDADCKMILNTLCQGADRNGNLIESYGTDASWRYQYSLAEVNRIFSSFTTYQFTEENDDDTQAGIDVDGERIMFIPATANTESAAITSAQYTDTEMTVYFTYDYASGDGRTTYTLHKKAVLQPDEHKQYRIVTIEETAETPKPVQNEAVEPQENAATTQQQAPDTQSQAQESQASSEFPVGIYSYVSSAGGQRSSMTIDASGLVTMKHMYAYKPGMDIYTYQMAVDDSVTPVEGMTAYLLQDVNGGDSRAMIYKIQEDVFTDVGITGSEWVRVG